MEIMTNLLVTLFLCGDVMTGRGIDQILPQSVDPILYEPYVRDARRYVALAEQVNGLIPQPVDYPYVWGDALEELERVNPDARIINLETAVTTHPKPWPRKPVTYRMHQDNAPVLTAAGIDVCALANNHTLDWHKEGLLETLDTLTAAGIRVAGAGRDAAAASAPAIVDIGKSGRVLVFSYGHPSSGVFPEWSAGDNHPGVNVIVDFSRATVEAIRQQVESVRQPRDIVVASIHWGGNWGYTIPREQIAFARRLIDKAGVDVIHGHSSHHVKAFEVYRGKPIFYGCGDFINDYEGIGGREEYRPDLVLMYFPTLEPGTGRLRALEMVPLQMRRMRLQRASREDAEWLKRVLNREGRRFGTGGELQDDGRLVWLSE